MFLPQGILISYFFYYFTECLDEVWTGKEKVHEDPPKEKGDSDSEKPPKKNKNKKNKKGKNVLCL